ncbi:MAG TPA: YbdK family carboxylate-amine ligase, partial [Burkholderiaceae bacterium]|nr:YbdK family carboxylate-amine ligase [Burkholderiaceae bacterium]
MKDANLEFGKSESLTMGVELELQLIDRRTGDLTRGASDLIALVGRQPFPGNITPEITESMLEVSTSIQHAFDPLRSQLIAIRDALVVGADRLDLEIAGGGTHPFQRWYDRQIYDRPRFRHVAGLYGYLAKQFTVFGQHVHIGCESGTQALWLLHRLSAYIPQFIALAASSPYFQGVDTAYDCARLNSVYAFPLSGRAPFLTDWSAFERFFGKLKRLGVVESMKDFYWDIRPKPEYGTIEVRVFDTPLTVERAAALAAYVQAICRMLLERPGRPESEDIYVTYNYNRFQACRFGLEGQLIDGATGAVRPVHQDVMATLEQVRPHARELGSLDAMDEVERWVRSDGNDARWQR